MCLYTDCYVVLLPDIKIPTNIKPSISFQMEGFYVLTVLHLLSNCSPFTMQKGYSWKAKKA